MDCCCFEMNESNIMRKELRRHTEKMTMGESKNDIITNMTSQDITLF